MVAILVAATQSVERETVRWPFLGDTASEQGIRACAFAYRSTASSHSPSRTNDLTSRSRAKHMSGA